MNTGIMQVNRTISIAALLVLLFVSGSDGSKISLTSSGGYKNIVVKIEDDGRVPEDKCPEILDNLKVGMSSKLC